MNNNNDHTEKLIPYLDGELSEAENAALQTELANNVAMQQELDDLIMAKGVVKNYGLTQKVSSIHQEMMQEMQVQDHKAKPIVRSLPQMMMRIAAAIIILVGVFGIYQYLSVSPGSLYKDQYTAYQVANMRGNTAAGTLEKAYAESKFDEVISLYTQMAAPAASEQFLAAQAYLGKEDYKNAISLFNAIIEKNKTANTGTLNDDAEYYLALSYLKNNETAKALPLFNKIHEDKGHLYHSKVSSWFLTKLKLLNWKN
jgi:tetratricopeptide (TPR) repeat protein